MEALRMRHARAEAPDSLGLGRWDERQPLDERARARLGAACPGARLVEVARLAAQAHIALAAGIGTNGGGPGDQEPETSR